MITISIMQRKKLSQDQSGLVAIIVTLIIMFVISITVISFAITSQRNGRQSLDRQLSTQAYYAAESGINDAVAVIKADVAASRPVTTKNGCPPSAPYDVTSNVVDASTDVSYTCLLVNPTPDELIYDNVQTSHSRVIPITPPGGSAYVELNWNTPGYTGSISGASCASGSPLPAAPFFPVSAAWDCNASGVVRVDVVDMGGGSFTRATATKTFFIYPVSGAPNGINDVSAISNGSVVGGSCSNPAPACHFKMNLAPGQPYVLRIRPIYTPIDSQIVAPNGAGTNLPINGSQVAIDSTGKARDVLRRVKVQIELTSNFNFPDYAIQSGHSVCKIAYLTNSQVNLEASLKPTDPTGTETNVCAP